MALLNPIKNIPLRISPLSTAWWVEITTAEPRCTYFFGPFQNATAAEEACPGYVEDLESEGALEIEVLIKYCKPEVLTLFQEEWD